LSTMSAVFSAALAVLRLDVLSRPGPTIQKSAEENASFINRSNQIGFLIFSVFFVLYVGLEKFVPFGRETYVNLLLGFYGAQVAFLPSLVAFVLSDRNATDVAWAKWIATTSVAIMTLIVKWRMWLLHYRINRV
jgi:hypothetical protein